jgi:hypothetical protein
MMGFCGEGEITKITTTKIGNVIIAVRDTQVAFNTASGHKMGERDYIWYLVSRTPQEGSHFRNVFFKGAIVWFTGKINQKKGTDEENNEYSRNIVFKIDGYISILILMFILINKYQLHIDFIKLLIK